MPRAAWPKCRRNSATPGRRSTSPNNPDGQTPGKIPSARAGVSSRRSRVMPDSWMTRAEPQFVWSVPSGLRAIDFDPVALPASRDSRLAPLAALGLSALIHAGVVALLLTVFLSGRDLTPPPVLD